MGLKGVDEILELGRVRGLAAWLFLQKRKLLQRNLLKVGHVAGEFAVVLKGGACREDDARQMDPPLGWGWKGVGRGGGGGGWRRGGCRGGVGRGWGWGGGGVGGGGWDVRGEAEPHLCKRTGPSHTFAKKKTLRRFSRFKRVLGRVWGLVGVLRCPACAPFCAPDFSISRGPRFEEQDQLLPREEG